MRGVLAAEALSLFALTLDSARLLLAPPSGSGPDLGHKGLKVLDLEDTPDGCRIGLKVVPSASRAGVAGLHGDRLKIAVQAPPVEGKANKALIKLLAEVAGISKSRVILVAGERTREKTVLLRGVTAEAMARRLKALGVQPD